MLENYKHLVIKREILKNPRRTKSPPRFTKRNDLAAHGQKLNGYFVTALSRAREQISSTDGQYVLKLTYDDTLTFENLSFHGVEFISQEGKQLCVVFADEQGLALFADHLLRLGGDDGNITRKQILEALNGIDNWTRKDRSSWAIENKGFPPEETFKLDVELWPVEVTHHPKRNQLCENFEHWLAEQTVSIVDKINLDSLLIYRVQVSHAQALMLLDHRDVRLVDLIPVSGISYQQLNCDIKQIPDDIAPPDDNAAKVCILDSGINTNHPLLKSAIAESRSFVDAEDEFDRAGHGTAVAGIALYGDVEDCDKTNYWNPKVWIYNGKIMHQCPVSGDAIFDAHVIENTLSTAVEHFVELGCRIFNISFGNNNSPYDGTHIRGIAYTLDCLARKFNVLFVVSAGNFQGSETPPIPRDSWRDEYPEYLLCDESVIIDPAPALNVLTVGGLALHNATFDEQRYPEISQLSPASSGQPSPFTRHGPSVKGALKPELVAIGGNLANPMRGSPQWQSVKRGLGVLTCNHDFAGKTLFKEISGTSFAAPYITHLAGRLLNEYPEASANLLRAMLVNQANLPEEVSTTFSPEMKKRYKESIKTKGREIARDVAGYGLINEDGLYRSTEHAVVLSSEDSIENNAHQFFELPLPADYLRTSLATRELRITLAHTPAVRTTRLDYIATRIRYQLVKGKSIDEIQNQFNHDTQKLSESHGEDAKSNRHVTESLRNKGTVQSSVWQFRRRNPHEKWFVVITRQDSIWGDSQSNEKEEYALVVTVTDHDNENALLYTQIRQRIQEQERTRIKL